MRLHSSIQSRILSLLFLLYTLDNNYNIMMKQEILTSTKFNVANFRNGSRAQFLIIQDVCLSVRIDSIFIYCIARNIARLKIGGSVHDHNIIIRCTIVLLICTFVYIHQQEMLAKFNLEDIKADHQTAKFSCVVYYHNNGCIASPATRKCPGDAIHPAQQK